MTICKEERLVKECKKRRKKVLVITVLLVYQRGWTLNNLFWGNAGL